MDTSDEWIVMRTGIRERRIAAKTEALSDLALPAVRQALAQAGSDGTDIDLLIVATVTPDMMFPSTSAILADRLGAADAAAYDLSAGCTGFMYALAQAYGMIAGGLARRALVVGGDVLSRILDWSDRSTVILFGDGAGAVVLEPSEEPGFLAFELGADGAGGENLWLPGSGSRLFEDPDRLVKMNGREVFKFATRVLVHSAKQCWSAAGRVSRTSTSTFPTRRTSASSITQPRSSVSRRSGWWSTSTVMATPRPARSRSRWPTRRRREGFGPGSSYS